MEAKLDRLISAMTAHADELPKSESMDEGYFSRMLDFRRAAGWPVKPPRKSRCPECAADNMYSEITRAQREMPKKLRIDLAARGFCHMTPACACRGECEETGVTSEVLALFKVRGQH